MCNAIKLDYLITFLVLLLHLPLLASICFPDIVLLLINVQHLQGHMNDEELGVESN